jgi:amino acid transporter
VATTIAGVLFAVHTVVSGAALRVHLVTALGLVAAFWLPALFVRRPKDPWVQPWPVLAVTCLGVLAFAVGAVLTVPKAQILDAAVLFVVGVPAVLALLTLHGLVVQRVSPGGY